MQLSTKPGTFKDAPTATPMSRPVTKPASEDIATQKTLYEKGEKEISVAGHDSRGFRCLPGPRTGDPGHVIVDGGQQTEARATCR